MMAVITIAPPITPPTMRAYGTDDVEIGVPEDGIDSDDKVDGVDEVVGEYRGVGVDEVGGVID
jgi:hypothetical protein